MIHPIIANTQPLKESRQCSELKPPSSIAPAFVGDSVYT